MENLKSEIAMKRNNTRKIEEMYYHKKVKFPKLSDIHNYREKLNERRIAGSSIYNFHKLTHKNPQRTLPLEIWSRNMADR